MNNKTPNRRERRNVMKMYRSFKRKSKLSYSKWLDSIRDSIKDGRELHSINKENTDKNIAEQLEAIELKRIEYWKELGYTDSEISKLREANSILTIRYIESWHEDKRRAREILKEVYKTRIARVYG